MSTNLCHPDSTHLHVMLSQLQCPFQVESDQVLCSFYQREAFCPFSHRSDHKPGTTIPPYICVDHLVGKCMAESTWEVSITDDWLAGCSVGYHPSWIQMIDLEQLDQKVQEAELYQEDEDLKCAICLEQIHSPFGLLRDCEHVFCAECIVEWQETDPRMRCPLCRKHSRRVLLWPNTEPIRNKQDKQQLFRLQDRCDNLFHGGNHFEAVTQQQFDGTFEALMTSFALFRAEILISRVDLAQRRVRRQLGRGPVNPQDVRHLLRMVEQLDVQREPVDFEDEVN